MELGDERGRTLIESGELFVRGKLARRFGRRGASAEAGDGSGQEAGVFRDQLDDFAVAVERAIVDGGSESAVGVGGDAGELGELEVGGAELLPQADDSVGVSAVDSEVLGAELAPARGDELKLVGLAQAMKAGSLGGGTAAGHEIEGLALAEDGTQVQQVGDVRCRRRLFHVVGAPWDKLSHG